MEDHMITPQQPIRAKTNTWPQRNRWKEKKISITTKYHKWEENETDHKIDTSWGRGITAPPPNIHIWPLWKQASLLSLMMQLRTFYSSLKADILEFIYSLQEPKAHRSVNLNNVGHNLSALYQQHSFANDKTLITMSIRIHRECKLNLGEHWEF